MLEMIYFERTGEQTPFRQIYKTIGEEKFRALESEVVLLLQHTQHSIIALGGGLILNPKNAASLAKLGQLVYLKVNKETLKRRILKKELPSFLDPADPESSFEHYYNERRPKYEAIPALSIDLETKTQDQVVLELTALIFNLEESHGQ